MEYVPLLMKGSLVIVMFFGVLLTLVGLPGNVLILAAAVLYGWQEDFARLNAVFLLTLAGAWLSGELLDFFAGVRGAKREKASWWATVAAMAGSIAGGIVGTGVMPLVGTIGGALLGGFFASYYVEYWQTSDKNKARQVAKGVVKGQIFGMAIKLAVAVFMVLTVLQRLWF